MSKTIAKKQHYIPRFYLKNFADSKEYLHVFNRDTCKFYQAGIKDVCESNYVYEVEYTKDVCNGERHYMEHYIEEILGVFENQIAPSYERMIARCEDSCFFGNNIQKDKYALCALAVNLLARNPMNLELNEPLIPEMVQELKSSEGLTQEDINYLEKTAWHDDYSALAALLIKQQSIFSLQPNHPINRIYQSFLSKHLELIKADKGASFIATSLPLYVDFDDKGEFDFREAYFPLSTSCAARFSDEKSPKTFTCSTFSKAGVDWINSQLLFGNDVWRFAYSFDASSLRESVDSFRRAKIRVVRLNYSN